MRFSMRSSVLPLMPAMAPASPEKPEKGEKSKKAEKLSGKPKKVKKPGGADPVTLAAAATDHAVAKESGGL